MPPRFAPPPPPLIIYLDSVFTASSKQGRPVGLVDAWRSNRLAVAILLASFFSPSWNDMKWPCFIVQLEICNCKHTSCLAVTSCRAASSTQHYFQVDCP